jgi:hypothetical protein
MSHFQDGCLLHFDHSIRHHKKEFGHKPIYDLSPVDKFQPDWKVLSVATRRALGVQAMVIAEAGIRAENGNSRDFLRIKKVKYVGIEKLVAGADVCVQMNYDSQRLSNV